VSILGIIVIGVIAFYVLRGVLRHVVFFFPLGPVVHFIAVIAIATVYSLGQQGEKTTTDANEIANPVYTSQETGEQQKIKQWRDQLVQHVGRFQYFPKGTYGRTSEVAFTVDHEGYLLNSNIAQSSGMPTFDKATLDMITRAQPMPKPPTTTLDRDRSFSLRFANP
jgi:TonB family protein